MKSPIKLLVGVDFGSTIDATLDTAVHLVQSLGGELVLSHAVEYVPLAYGTDFSEERAAIAHIDRHLRQRCEELQARGITASHAIPQVGTPYKNLLEDADNADADAIVIGVSNRGAVDRFILGSTAENVVRVSRRPVFLRHPEDRDDFSSILCAVDFSDHSEHTLANALVLARKLGSKLHVLHVEPQAILYPGLNMPVYEACLPPSLETVQEQFDRFLEDFDTSGVALEQHLATGTASSEILTKAMELKPGLLVLGKHGHGGFIDRLIGSVATHILRDLPCSLLVISDQDL